MSVTCPDGHTSNATDFCDVCGAPIGAAGASAAPSAAPSASPGGSAGAGSAGAGSATPAGSGTAAGAAAASGGGSAPPASTTLCPNCGTAVATDALFCEGCGRDMVTGQLPTDRPAPAPADAEPEPRPSTGWVAEVWVDEEWFAARGEGRCPTVGEPATFPVADGSLIGRRSKSRNIHPDVDCSADGSVSGRQALLGFNGTIWTITDLGSTNGTFIAHPGDPLPTEPIEPNQPVELETGDRILIGGHTRVVILPEATPAP